MRGGPFTIRSIHTNDKDKPPLSEEAILTLMESMRAVGLINPITVQLNHSRPFLVAGRHRLEAAKRLKWKEIEAVELPPFESFTNENEIAALAEIAENLHRREITALERAELQARWVDITSKGKPREVREVSKGGRGKRGGVEQAARDLNVPATNLRQSVRIASLSNEAKEAAKASGLDRNQSALLKAAKEKTPERQVEALRERTRKMLGSDTAPKPASEKEPEPEPEIQKLGYRDWQEAIAHFRKVYECAPDEIRSEFQKAMC